MREYISVFKAELQMKVAGFISQKHTNPLLKGAAKTALWLNKKRYGDDALSFLEGEKSIDIMNDSDYE
jgi:hypothetical protein